MVIFYKVRVQCFMYYICISMATLRVGSFQAQLKELFSQVYRLWSNKKSLKKNICPRLWLNSTSWLKPSWIVILTNFYKFVLFLYLKMLIWINFADNVHNDVIEREKKTWVVILGSWKPTIKKNLLVTWLSWIDFLLK